MKLPRRIKLDIDQEYYNLIPAQQGDTARGLNFQILNNNIPFSLENKTVRARIKKPDGNVCYNDMEIINVSEGECDLKLTNQILIKPGMCKVQLEIMENGEILSTIIFAIFIRESIDIKDAAESTNEFTALENGIIKLDEWDKYFKETSGAIEEKYTERLNGINSSLEESNNQIASINNNKLEKIDAETTYAKKTEVSTLVANKATKQELEVERARIDSFTSLQEGSTTGDAELVDGRVGANGKVYSNIGENVRAIAKGEGIQNGGITPWKTSFINSERIIGVNKFNKDDETIKQGYYIANDGREIVNASTFISPKIPVGTGDVVRITDEATTVGNPGLIYDVNGNAILKITDYISRANGVRSILLPKDDRISYILFNNRIDKLGEIMVTINKSLPSSYTPYTYEDKYELSANISISKFIKNPLINKIILTNGDSIMRG